MAAAAGLAQLHHLDLSHNDLGPAAAQALQQLMVNAEQLQSLVLMNTAVGGAGEQISGCVQQVQSGVEGLGQHSSSNARNKWFDGLLASTVHGAFTWVHA